jgi:hypothetical protein
VRRWQVIEGWVKEFGWTKGAELGVFRGDTFFYLLDHCPQLTMIGVDSWRPVPEKQLRFADGGRSYEKFDLAGYERKVRERAAKFGNRATIHKMTTLEAAALVPDASLDFVFIDADHLYEGVRADIAAWRPKVKPGGYLSGHDYHPGAFEGVVRAVDELCAGFTRYDDSVWAVEVSD